MKFQIKHIILLAFSLTFVSIFSQAKFYAKGRSVAYTGQTYAITFVLENGKGTNFKMPQSYPGFQIVGGPNQSSNYSWVNGKTTSSISYTYYLQAIKEGPFNIPVASVTVGGETLITKSFKVTIQKGQQKAANQQQHNSNRNRQQQQQQSTPTDNGDWKKQIAENLYVKMYTDKQNPFVGEQVTLYLKLYQRVQTFQTQVTEMPEFKGFWVNDFKLQAGEWKKEEVDGVWFNTMMINKYALFPQRAGDFNLSPIKLATLVQLKTQSKSNSIWEQFFGSYENKEYPFQSNGVKIKVKALPIENVPETFTGAVGKFKFSASIDSLNTETGKAITLKTKITGTGNIMMIDAPNVILPEAFEIYDPQEKEYISKKSTYINGSKKYDYLMIPNKPGVFNIDSIPFSYFDLKSKKYNTIYSDGFKINVKPSADYVEEKAPDPNDESILDSDIKNLHTVNDIAFYEDKFIGTKTFWSLWSGSVVFAFFLLIGKNRLENYNPDFVAINRKKANKIALSKLKKASEYLKSNDKKAFYNEIVRSLWDYVSLKLNMLPESLSKENIQEKLLEFKVSETTANSYIDLINKSEMAVYSPIGETEMQKDFEKAKEIIINVEGEIV
jgi:hypothetical protein